MSAKTKSSPGARNVTVAVTVPFPLVFEVAGAQPRHDAPWSELPNIEVQAGSEATLREVLREACDVAGARLAEEAREADARHREREGLPPTSPHAANWLVFFDFWRPGDDDIVDSSVEPPVLGRNTRQPLTTAIVRDDSGRARWLRPGLEATMAELVDATAVGLLEGDPLRVYLIPSVPQGDIGALSDWITFGNALKALGAIYVAANVGSAVDGVLGLADRVRTLRARRTLEAADVVAEQGSAWSRRGAAPSDLLQILASRARSADEIAALLGCAPSEAEALLWGLGFTFDEDQGVWRYRGDQAAKLIADNVEIAFADLIAVVGDISLLRELAGERVGRFLREGTVPPIEDARRELNRRWEEEIGQHARPGFLSAILWRVRGLTRFGQLIRRRR